jgi:hypothetical protein
MGFCFAFQSRCGLHPAFPAPSAVGAIWSEVRLPLAVWAALDEKGRFRTVAAISGLPQMADIAASAGAAEINPVVK